MQEWGGIKAPPPALKPVQVDAKTTAVLMLDSMKSELRQPAAPRRHDPGREEAAERFARGQGVGRLFDHPQLDVDQVKF